MTGQRETTRYAVPSLRRDPRNLTPSMTHHGSYLVTAHPWDEAVGRTEKRGPGWTAHTPTGLYAGLWPTKQAAAEVLVKQAGYELELT